MLAQKFPDWDVEKAFLNTGVAIRSVAEKDQCTSDLGIIAAQKLFASGICEPKEIEFLLFCTQGPDYILPDSACIIQDRLGLPTSCGAYWFNLGCSGYVYGLALAKGLIESPLVNNVLLIVGDTPSKAVNMRDRGALALFSDGASATFISGMESEEELIGPFLFGTDGRGAKNLIMPAGAFRSAVLPGDKDRKRRRHREYQVNGRPVYGWGGDI